MRPKSVHSQPEHSQPEHPEHSQADLSIPRFVASSNSVQLRIRERMRARSCPPDIHNSISSIDRRRSPFFCSTGVLVVRNLYVLSVRKVGRSSYYLISSRRTSLNQAHTEAT